ncbi:MAG: YkvA family protein [Gammaproteobacteria bacterium]|nr:YkvA family protein [Gammaproteobacteria bacterium]
MYDQAQFFTPPLQQAVDLVSTYINQILIVLDRAQQHPHGAGESETIAPLIQIAANYFIEPMDYIPDRIGIYGLLDDAYLCLRMLEAIDHVYVRQCGSHLLPMNLAPMNQSISFFFGSTLRTQLDTEIKHAVEQRAFEEQSMQSLAQKQYNTRNTSNATSASGWFEDKLDRFLFDYGMVN